MSKPVLSLDRASAATEGEARLPRPPGVIRRFWARHPWLADSLIAAAYLVPTLVAAIAVPVFSTHRPAWAIVVSVACVLVATAAILFRRHRPVTVFTTVWVATIVISLVAGQFDILPSVLAVYAVAVYRSARAAWIALAISVPTAIAAAYLAAITAVSTDVVPYGAPPAAAATQQFVLLLIVGLIGINVGNRRRYLQALIDRASQLARERDQQAQIATAAERARIAREMHDVVSHSLTVMVTLAEGSAASVAADPERATDAMRRVASAGRGALSDMRRMLGVLTSDELHDTPELHPQPGVADLHGLVERFRAAGLPVRFEESGSAPDDAGFQLTIHRIVQESLTNVLRHAPSAASVEVVLSSDADSVTIRVDDTGSVGGATALQPTTGAGRGLVGMRERAAAYGGTLSAGPLPHGWRVEAHLPRNGTS